MCYYKNGDSGRASDSDVTSGSCYAANQTSVDYRANADGDTMDKAADADVVLFFVSTSSGEGFDRTSLSYSSDDEDSLSKLAGAVGNKVVVCAVSPGAVLMPWKDDVASILLSFMPGQMYSFGLAELLFGDVSPSGRLPLTLPNKENEQEFTQEQ